MSRSKVKDQGHQGQKTGFSADISGIAELTANKDDDDDDDDDDDLRQIYMEDVFEGQGQFRRPACGLYISKSIFALVNPFVFSSLTDHPV